MDDVDETLIDLVQQYRLLYDKRDSGFKNKLMKKKRMGYYWQYITIISNLFAAEEVEHRWIVLRNRYVTEKRKIKNESASGAAGGKRYKNPVVDKLGFIEEFVVPRRSTGNVPKEKLTEQPTKNPEPSVKVWDSFNSITHCTATDVELLEPEDEVQSEQDENFNNQVCDVFSESSSTSSFTTIMPTTPVSNESSSHALHTAKLRSAEFRIKRKKSDTENDILQNTIQKAFTTLEGYITNKNSQDELYKKEESFGKTVALMLAEMEEEEKKQKMKKIMNILLE